MGLGFGGSRAGVAGGLVGVVTLAAAIGHITILRGSLGVVGRFAKMLGCCGCIGGC